MDIFKKYRELTFTMATMDLKLKYQSSKIGFLWSFLKPLLQFCAYYTVFQIILHSSDEPDYALRLFLGILLWTFFTEGTSNGLNAYLNKKSIVTKIKVEKKILPIASFLTAFFNFLLTMLVFLVVYHCASDDFTYMYSLKSLGIFAFFLMTYSILIISVNIILATLNVLFRDLQNIWEIVLMYGVFLSPIIYTLPIPEGFLGVYYFLNPLAFPIEEIKSVFFENAGSWNTLEHFWCYIAAVIMWVCIAIVTDRKLRSKVADYL